MAKLPYTGTPLSKLLAGQNRVRQSSSGRYEQSSRAVYDQLQQGIALQKKGSFGLAADIYQRVLAQHPNHPDALHLMGTAAMAARQIDAAIDYFTRASNGKPKDPSIRVNLANALIENDEPATAEFHLRKALKLEPNLLAALCLLANCRAAQGDNEDAKRIYEGVLARAPDYTQALLGYADLCQTLGEMEVARAAYRKASKFAPAPALAGLATCEKLAKDSPEAAEILRCLNSPRLRPIEYRHLSYAAARIAAAAGDYDEAFAHFSQAKELGTSSFDIEAHRRELDTFRGIFTSAFLEAHAKHGHQSARPVFVVGMPRSGTTLAEQIISRHPKVGAAGELPDIGRLASSLGLRAGDDGRDYAKRLAKLTPPTVRELAGRYLAALDRFSAVAQRITDKMPQNFLHLGLIALLFPNARIIHCRRDPLDTCISCFTTQLRDHNHSYAGSLRTLGLYYREYASLMAYWRKVLPKQIYELEYERLVLSPEEETRELIGFLGLAWDPACLSPDDSARPVRTLSRMQVRQPIYRSSIGRWRHYEKHLGPLKTALSDLISQSP